MQSKLSTEPIPNSLLEFIEKGYRLHDEAHDVGHVWLVFNNALEIILMRKMQLTDEQWKVLPYLTLCHDLLDHKQPIENKLPAEEVFSFYEQELGHDLATVISYIHDNCSWSKRAKSHPVTIPGYEHYEQLRLLLQDSDWLEAIGHGGIERCRQCQSTWFPTKTPEQIKARIHAHMDEKLFLVYDAFNFDETRRIADQRNLINPMVEFRNA